MSEIDNRLLYQIFKEGNYDKLYNITTYDKLLRMTLKDPETRAPLDNEVSVDNLAQIAEVIQTCTRHAEFTHDILRKYGHIEGLGKYIRVIHAGKTEIDSARTIKYQTSVFPERFTNGPSGEDAEIDISSVDEIKLNAPALKLNSFQKFLKKVDNNSNNSKGRIGYAISRDDVLAKRGNFLIRNKFSQNYNIAWLVNDNLPELLGIAEPNDREARSRIPSDSNKLTDFFNCNKTYSGKTITDSDTLQELNAASTLPTKNNTSLSTIQVMTPGIRLANRQTAELSTFMSLVNSTEMSKCMPYLSAEFVLPRQFEQSGRKFRTATMTNFLFDSFEQPTDESILRNFHSFERNDVVTTTYRGNKLLGTRSPMAPFLMPQTLVNADEKIIGHPSNRSGRSLAANSRLTPVQDPFKPFMTIDSLTIEVVPQRELMSFKTAKMSITLHDKSRMGDIAPFIKPDLFGVFGGEIAIEYGWSHPDTEVYLPGESPIQSKLYNPVGKFLNAFRNKEKYAIINSTFNIQENGQVKIELSLAMKGAIEIRGKKLFYSKTLEGLQRELEALRQRFFSINTNIVVEEINANNLPQLNDVSRPINRIAETASNLTSFINGIIINSQNINPEQIKTIRALTNRSLKQKIQQPINADSLPAHAIQAFSSDLDLRQAVQLQRNLLDLITILGRVLAITGNTAAIRREKEKGIMSYCRNWFDPYLDTDYLKSLTYFENHYEIKSGVERSIGGRRISRPSSAEGSQNHQRKVYSVSGRSIFNPSELSAPNYSSFGSFLVSFIGSPLLYNKRFDEIQFIFYNLNSYASESHDRNIASLPIDNNKMREFVKGFLEKVSQISLEGFLQQVIKKFIEGKASPLYGMHNIFESASDAAGDRPKRAYRKQNDRNTAIDVILRRAYGMNDESTGIVEFRPPKIGLSFDTLMPRSNRGGIDKTILKISIYDKNDHPFGTMFEHFDQEVGGQIIKLSRRYSDAKYKRNANTLTGTQFINLTRKIAQEAEQYFTLRDDNTLEFNGINGSAIKEFYQKFMPTAHFGTQNTALLKATASTVNDARINTAFMTQADRNVDVRSNVAVDVPLNILPNHVDLEMIGCPIIDFGQMMFLDFITGTSVDNIYNVTGITHTISQGQFTTRVKVTYGDIYGKYVAAAGNLSTLINNTSTSPRESTSEVRRNISSIKSMFSLRSTLARLALENTNLDYTSSDYSEGRIMLNYNSLERNPPAGILQLDLITNNGFYTTYSLRDRTTAGGETVRTFGPEVNNTEDLFKIKLGQDIPFDSLESFINIEYIVFYHNVKVYRIILNLSPENFVFKKLNRGSRTRFKFNLKKSIKFKIELIDESLRNQNLAMIEDIVNNNRNITVYKRVITLDGENITEELRPVYIYRDENIINKINFNLEEMERLVKSRPDDDKFLNYPSWQVILLDASFEFRENKFIDQLLSNQSRFLDSLVRTQYTNSRDN